MRTRVWECGRDRIDDGAELRRSNIVYSCICFSQDINHTSIPDRVFFPHEHILYQIDMCEQTVLAETDYGPKAKANNLHVKLLYRNPGQDEAYHLDM